MTVGEAITGCFSKYATFEGRASRSEYWYFVLFAVICSITARIIDLASGTAFWLLGFGYLSLACSLLTILPNISAVVRRLHDIDRSGWWVWLSAVPLVGIVLIVWLCRKGTNGDNRFGSDPLANNSSSRLLVPQQNHSTKTDVTWDTSNNRYCVTCGQSAMPTFRLCPSCGSREFIDNPLSVRR
jgi:uncharacterized membrane protein YhaH (DUF805 family)